MCIDIKFADFDAAFVFFGNCVNCWSYCAAWGTPSRPEIDQHWCVGLQNFVFEVVIRDLDRISAHVSSKKNSTLVRQSSTVAALYERRHRSNLRHRRRS